MSTLAHAFPGIPDLARDDARRDLARILAALFEQWALPTEQQLALLGMSPESRKVLAQYRRGERALPNSRDTLDRAGYLLGIHKGLRLLFPEDPELRFGWVRRRNRMLDGRTPLEVMLEEGLVGLARIARFVDFQRGQ
ncbi:antitoxin Xre/MbcA/ParS toxin-binding domain-containing protein [Luteimonas salinilitoris]|uniref:Antitoxin Xre/MbcA/ParS toxin-binding domain-containing protein n=1 Tax=Luteimonas salinilitoris TaxID=3237697 RepID=A0ABV4HN84_9GAMM